MIAVDLHFYDEEGNPLGSHPCIFSRWVNIQKVEFMPAKAPASVGLVVDGLEIWRVSFTIINNFEPGSSVQILPGDISVELLTRAA